MPIRRFLTWLTAMALLVGAAFVEPASAGTGASDKSGQTYLVTLRHGADLAAALGRERAAGRALGETFRSLVKGYAVVLTEDEAAALAADPAVARVEPDGVATISENRVGATWGIDRVDQRALPLDGTYAAPDAPGQGSYVYVVDTGVRSSHLEFGGRVEAGFETVADGGGTEDCHGHGTHVAATAAGATFGVASAATIVPVRVLGCTGSGSWASVIAGLDFIAADTARRPAVVNMSLGGPANATLDEAVLRLVASGVTVVVAAGNNNVDACAFSPARVAAAVTVGATTSADARASYSNYGSCVSLFAPGTSITSAWSTSDEATATISGTSMATPHVAGSAALLLATNPALPPEEVAALLATNATPDVVAEAGAGSPTRLLFTGGDPAHRGSPNTTFAAAAPVDLDSGDFGTMAAEVDPSVPVSSDGSVQLAGDGVTVSGEIRTLAGDSTFATKEAGEPDHAGDSGGASLWYDVTCATDTSVWLSTEGSSFDTLLGVYLGNEVDALTAVASSDDATGGTWSETRFGCRAGVVHHVAVDGKAGARGPLVVSFGVVAPPVLLTTSLPPASTGQSYQATLAAGGGTGTFSWFLDDGALPAGLLLSTDGRLSGTPTAAGRTSFTVTVADQLGATATATLSMSVTNALAVTTTSLPAADAGTSYAATLASNGGVAPFTWSAGALPAGLSLSAEGVLAGSPSTAGTFVLDVEVTDGEGRKAAARLSLTVRLAIGPAVLPGPTLKVPYSVTLAAYGGSQPLVFALAGGSLPAGLTLTSDGRLSGTPTKTGSYTVTIKVTDAGKLTAQRSFALKVTSALVVSTSSLSGGTVGSAYRVTLAASGGESPYNWSVVAGALPAGLSLAGNVISGTPTTAGTASFTVAVADNAGRMAQKNLSIVVAASTTTPGSGTSVPAAFKKSSPATRATGQSRTALTLKWLASTGATSYEYCISSTKACGTTSTGWLPAGTATSIVHTAGLGSKVTYYWEVRAVNAAGATLADSGSWWMFTTAV